MSDILSWEIILENSSFTGKCNFVETLASALPLSISWGKYENKLGGVDEISPIKLLIISKLINDGDKKWPENISS